MALAGTKDREETPWDQKNRKEQAFVSQYIEERLKPLCQQINRLPIETLRTGNLYHLCTRFQFIPKEDTDLEKLTQTLHPTPAVCGLPKEEAMHFITENEGYNRRYYAGYVGPMNTDGEAHLYVNIRCAELHTEGKATLYAGSGLLSASTLESERKEIEQKIIELSY